jgi:peroxiredoxin Q/BCP
MSFQRLQSLIMLGLVLASALASPNRATALEVGEQAPDFTLPSTAGKDLSLSQFRGKQPVLIEFYGQDFSPV